MRPMSIEWRLKNLYKCQKCTAVQEAAIANAIFTQDDMFFLGGIRLKFQVEKLKTEVTCYVIDNETSLSLLLGRPWIHDNRIVPPTLHQRLKYVDI